MCFLSRLIFFLDFNAVFNNDSNSSSSRRPSLIDTDKTIVAENHDEIVGSQQGLLSIDVKNDDLADDEPLTKGNLFRQGSVSLFSLVSVLFFPTIYPFIGSRFDFSCPE